MLIEPQVKLAAYFPNICEKYIDDAAFFWQRRCYLLEAPNYTHQDLIALDNRIDIELDGLMSMPEDAWPLCEQAALEMPYADNVFVISALAFRSLDVRKIQVAVEIALANPSATKGLISAMAWLPGRLVHSWIKKFLTSKDLNHKYLALAVCSARREDPREYLSNILQRDDCIGNELLYMRALRLIGELKRFDLVPALRRALDSDNQAIRFHAISAQVMLGDKSQATLLTPWLAQPGPYQLQAFNLCVSALPMEAIQPLLHQLVPDQSDLRLAIQATAIWGAVQLIPWLINQMLNPALSRLAGEAFTTITGIDIEAHQLALKIPDLDHYLPDDGAQNEELSASDDGLPFPDPNKIAAVWKKYQLRFNPACRYFMGQALTDKNPQLEHHLKNVFQNGTQRQRARAALELSLLIPAQYLLNYAAKDCKGD